MRTPPVGKIVMEFCEAWFHSAVGQLKSMTLEKAYIPKHRQHVTFDGAVFAKPVEPAICQGVPDPFSAPLLADYETIEVARAFAGAHRTTTNNVAVYFSQKVFGCNRLRALRAIE